MKQYCRYCINCCYGDIVWCAAKQKEIQPNTAKSLNNCKQFEFCQIDALGLSHIYRARGHPSRSTPVAEKYDQIAMKL